MAPQTKPAKEHHYDSHLTWTGNRGEGTTSYQSYDRSFDLEATGKPIISGSSDPAFRGDPSCWNPEDLLLSSVSSCHMLWFLHLASTKGIKVQTYEDHCQGVMTESASGGGEFSSITLAPRIVLDDPGSPEARAKVSSLVAALHHQANKLCFIANSLSLPVTHNSKTDFR